MKTKRKPKILVVIFLPSLIISGFIISAISLYHFSAPYIWIFGSWFIILAITVITVSRKRLKVIFLYFSLLFLALGSYEAYLWSRKSDVKIFNLHSIGLQRRDDELGYRPFENRKCVHTRKIGDETIFKVLYTINSQGLRISPPHRPTADRSILFFGGSFTFGVGVADEETLPYQMGIESDGKYRIYNFGFKGYGPHQMLVALENGLVESIIKAPPRYVVYQALPGHIQRVTGETYWDKHGPAYNISDDGNIIYTGHFDDRPKNRLALAIRQELKKSFVFKKNAAKIRYFPAVFGKEYPPLYWGDRPSEIFNRSARSRL